MVPRFLQFLNPGNARPNQRIHLTLRQGGEFFFLLVDQAKKSHGDLLMGVRIQLHLGIVDPRIARSTMARLFVAPALERVFLSEPRPSAGTGSSRLTAVVNRVEWFGPELDPPWRGCESAAVASSLADRCQK